MRRRNPPYRYRRRRGPERSTILGILVLAAAVAAGVFVVVDSSPSGGASSAASAASAAGDAGAATAGGSHKRAAAAARRATRARRVSPRVAAENREIGATLRYTSFVANGTRRRRAIALTFDDGPGPYTSAVLRILLRMHATATFFVLGQELRDFSGALRSEIQHGFAIGDHTQNHAWLVRLNARGQQGQIDVVARELGRYGAPAPRLFRPPYGAFNRATLTTLRRSGMLMVLWSIDPSDWRRPGARAIVANVLAHSKPGAVVIMHDGGGDRSQTVAALPAIINGLRRRHYGLVTVPRLLALDPPPRHQRPPHLSGV